MKKSEFEAIIGKTIDEKIKALQEPQRKYMEAGDPPTEQKTAGAPAIRPNGIQEEVDKGIRAARFIKIAILDRGRGNFANIAKAFYPKDIKLFNDMQTLQKALSEGVAADGGFLTPTEYSTEVIELLVNRTTIRKAGARTITLAKGSLQIPKVTAGSTASWIGENTNLPHTKPEFGQITMVLKKLGASAAMSNDLLRDNSYNADVIVRDDLVNQFAIAEDLAFLRGKGSESAPRGIYYWVNSANKFDANGTVTVANVNTDLSKVVVKLLEANIPMEKCAWVFTPRTYSYLFNAMNSNGQYVWQAEMAKGTLLGFPYFVTNQILNTYGSPAVESEIYFGDFSQVIIGDGESLVIEASTEATYWNGAALVSAFSQDQTIVKGIERTDICLRYDKAFVVMEKVKWGYSA